MLMENSRFRSSALAKADRCCASSSKGKDRSKDVPATAIVLPTFQKDPLLTKTEYKIRAQNRTYLYVRFWAYLVFFCLTIFCVMVFWLCVFPFVFSPWKRRKPFRLTKTGYPPKRLACGRGWWMRRAVLARRSGLFFQVLFANSVQMTYRHPPLPR